VADGKAVSDHRAIAQNSFGGLSWFGRQMSTNGLSIVRARLRERTEESVFEVLHAG
jgi:hypothetical protein